MTHSTFARIAAASLLVGTSFGALATAAQAKRILFSTTAIPVGEIAIGEEIVLPGGTTQVLLEGGGIASFVDAARFSLRADGAIDLREGAVTVVSASGAPVEVHMPEGVRGAVSGEGASASFATGPMGSKGSVVRGEVMIVGGGATSNYSAGQFWAAKDGRPDRVVTAGAQNAPQAGTVRSTRVGGIAAAAANGVPVALGDALQAAGAAGDIVSAARRVEAYDANPSLANFPSGDYALLSDFAARAAFAYGEASFPGAGSDIVLTYFQYLATGGQPGDFRSAYARILLDYLDLVRSGALPSGFDDASQAQLSAYLAYIGRTDGFGGLSASNRALLDAYLAFLQNGGGADGFAVNVSGLIGSYLDFLRAGGDPEDFTGASGALVAQYLGLIRSSGFISQLTPANRALLDAYLADIDRGGSGLVFSAVYATELSTFVAYLNGGGLPSGYTSVDAATLRLYLETLAATGLFDRVLGTQAGFLRAYLTFLQRGGTPDQFEALPITLLTAQAGALNAYLAYLQAGGLPSSYEALTSAQIRAYLDAIAATGFFDRFFGTDAVFFTDYLVYVRGGGDPDLYAGLPTVDLNAYARALTGFVAYLRAGNLPSGYTLLSAAQIRSYLVALSVAGELAALLGGNAGLLEAYLAWLQTGGNPDQFAGLPIITYQTYAAELNAFIAFLNAGGAPSAYADLTLAEIRAYLELLQANGQFVALLGANAALLSDYLVYIQGGGQPDQFAQLPIVILTGYAGSLNLFYAYLAGGGLPSGYTLLSQAQVRAYLEALAAAGRLEALVGANATFLNAYLAWVRGGGSPDLYTALPAFPLYLTAIQDFYVYLAAGGVPTGYSAIDLDRLLAYIQALDAAGVLASGVTDPDRLAFFRNYAVYLAGGGNPDTFADLPGDSDPGPSPTPTPGIAVGERTGQAVIVANYANFDTTQSTSPGNKVIYDSDGVIRSYTNRLGSTFNQANATVPTDERGSIDGAIGWARFTGQTPNGVQTPQQGYHVITGTPATDLPTSGRVDYHLIGATRPTAGEGGIDPGRFDGTLAVDFTSRKVGFDLDITLGQYGWAVRTTGGAANPNSGGYNITASQGLNGNALISGTTAASCVTSCNANVNGFLLGPAVSHIGLAYGITDNVGGGNLLWVSGVAAFANRQPASPPPPPPVSGTESGQRIIAFAGNGAVDFGPVGDAGSVAYDAQGKLSGYDSFTQGRVTRTTATAADAGGVAGIIGWARWTSGTTDKQGFGPYSANQGLHIMTGSATSAAQMPTSGTVTYNQIGGTNPTLINGAAAPGTLTGRMTVAFGSLPKVGLDLTMTVGQYGWRYESAGGIANPSASALTVNNFGQFGMQGVAISGTTAASCQGTCQGSGSGNISGQFYGPNASHAGVHFGVIDVSGGGAVAAGGIAIFAR